MKCYKVVRNWPNATLWSAMGLGASLTYRRGRTTRPHKGDGPLAVFEDLASASAFSTPGSYDGMEVWLAACRLDPVDSEMGCDHCGKEGRALWYIDSNGDRKGIHHFLLPTGTRLARAVRLVKKVEPE